MVTRVEVWENEKSCENTSHKRVYLRLFLFSQTFMSFRRTRRAVSLWENEPCVGKCFTAVSSSTKLSQVVENEKSCGKTSCRQVLLRLCQVLPNVNECYNNIMETTFITLTLRKCSMFPYIELW